MNNPNDTIDPDDTTVIMQLSDLPLWVRVNHELSADTLVNLDRVIARRPVSVAAA
jgi:hypothetical protein